MFIHGGKSNGYHADMYFYNFSKKKWYFVKYEDKYPMARYGHCMVNYENSIYLLGGYDQQGFCSDDLFRFSPINSTWTQIDLNSTTIHIGRYHSSACIYKTKIIIFGGKSNETNLNDLLEYDVENNNWKLLKSSENRKSIPINDSINQIEPRNRWGHTSNIIGHYLYVYGGRDSIIQFSDLYCFDLIKLKWRLLLPSPKTQNPNNSSSIPEPRYFHSSVVYANSIFFVFGKNIYDFNFDEIFEWKIISNSGDIKVSKQDSPRIKLSSSDFPIEEKIRIKCQFKDEIRIFSISPSVTYSKLLEQIVSHYEFNDVKIEYKDNEGDTITIRSDSDIQEAFNYSKQIKTSFKLKLSALTSSENLSVENSDSFQKTQSVEFSNTNSNYQTAKLEFNVQNAKLNSSFVIKWKCGSIIGEGGFGKVYLAINCNSGELFAVKQVPLDLIDDQQKINALRREIALMETLDHPNIVKYLGSEINENFLNIFLEYQAGGSIVSLISKFHQLEINIVQSFTRQILNGLEYLHQKGIAHRDIKGANVLVDLNGTIKLADFGTSKRLNELLSYKEGCKTFTGSPYWMAPEVIQGNSGGSYGCKADIWSLGAVVIEMLTGHPPFHNLPPVTALFRIGSSSASPEIPQSIPNQLKDFLSFCFIRDPSKRPTASLLLLHPWIKKNIDSNQTTFKNLGPIKFESISKNYNSDLSSSKETKNTGDFTLNTVKKEIEREKITIEANNSKANYHNLNQEIDEKDGEESFEEDELTSILKFVNK